jgi:hypothetical protein
MTQRTAEGPPRTRGVAQPQTGSGPPVATDWPVALRRGWQLMTQHASQVAGPSAAGLRITVRGALVGMFALCLAADLMADLLHLEVLIGIGFCAACVLAPGYVTRQALLEIVAAPPVTFLLSLVLMQAFTAQGDSNHATVLSVLEGTLLTLAAIAPWLFAGTTLCVIISVRRGLMQCIRDLGTDLRGQARPDAAVDTSTANTTAANTTAANTTAANTSAANTRER